MGPGYFASQNGSFNPAVYTHRFPASFRAGSLESRFYPGVSPGQLLGPLDPNDLEFDKVSSSIESDQGSLVDMFNVFERQKGICRDYQCCGVNLTDRHALVKHVEECHVVVIDPYNPQQQTTHRPQTTEAAVSQPVCFPTLDILHTFTPGSFNPDNMELHTRDVNPPPPGSPLLPDTPISTPISPYPNAQLQAAAQQASRPAPVPAFCTTIALHALHPSASPIRSPVPVTAAHAKDLFDTYAEYSNNSSHLPGTSIVSPMLTLQQENRSPQATGAPPKLSNMDSLKAKPSNHASSGSASTGTSTTPSRPLTSLLFSKPFKCPKPNCSKSYKQANGLKYHMTRGSCNLTSLKDLEQIQALLRSKRNQKPDGDNEPISDAELREVEKEAERILRPYACGVGACHRRYKNMNGLRYHYQHSGDHGAIGLALLTSGQHEYGQHKYLKNTHTHSRNVTPTTFTA